MTPAAEPTGQPAAAPDLAAKLRSPDYLKLLAFTAALGVPISAAAYWLLDLISHLQHWIFDANELPQWLGFDGVPVWWPLLPLALAGLLVGLTIRHMPGGGGHSPADGFKPGGAPSPIELPSVVLAAVATLALGAVLGPEAPLIAIGGGLGVCAVRLAQRNAPAQTAAIVAAAGSFAAISALLGSPILGAFLLMEASGLGGVTLDLVLVPGLLSAGLGYLVFVGLDAWTGHGTFSLAIPNLPPISRPTGTELLWAPVIGIIAAVLGLLIRRSALTLRSQVAKRIVVLTTVAGVAIAGAAILYGQVTGHASTDVLFDGQSALPALLQNSSSFTVGALLMLVVCKGAAYSISLSSFRGGPTFPGMYIGAAGGLAMSHLPGLRSVPGAAMGIGAMCVVMLNLPMTSVLLATLFLLPDGVAVMPLVIVAVVVAYVAAAHLAPVLGAKPKVIDLRDKGEDPAAVAAPPDDVQPNETAKPALPGGP